MEKQLFLKLPRDRSHGMEEEHKRDVLFHLKLFWFDVDLPFCSINVDKW